MPSNKHNDNWLAVKEKLIINKWRAVYELICLQVHFPSLEYQKWLDHIKIFRLLLMMYEPIEIKWFRDNKKREASRVGFVRLEKTAEIKLLALPGRHN